MTGFTYRYAFAIDDDQATTLHLRRQAILVFPEIAAERGIRITGDVVVTFDDDHVVCEADAEPIPGRRVRAVDRYGLVVAELAGRGFNDRQIAEAIGGVSGSTVFEVRRALKIPAADKRGHRQAAA
jgi:hypothetical protein